MSVEKLEGIEVGYPGEQYIFTMKMISIAQSDVIEARLAAVGSKATDRLQLEYDICRNAIGEHVAEMPQKLVEIEGEWKPAPLDTKGTPADVIAEHFKERTKTNERIIRTAFNVFQSQLNPAYRFLSRSV